MKIALRSMGDFIRGLSPQQRMTEPMTAAVGRGFSLGRQNCGARFRRSQSVAPIVRHSALARLCVLAASLKT